MPDVLFTWINRYSEVMMIKNGVLIAQELLRLNEDLELVRKEFFDSLMALAFAVDVNDL